MEGLCVKLGGDLQIKGGKTANQNLTYVVTTTRTTRSA
jgi:hypothetical protein